MVPISDPDPSPFVESPERYHQSSAESPLAQSETFAAYIGTVGSFEKSSLESVCQLASEPSFVSAVVEDHLAPDIAIAVSTCDAFEPLEHNTFNVMTPATIPHSEASTKPLENRESSKASTEPEPRPPASRDATFDAIIDSLEDFMTHLDTAPSLEDVEYPPPVPTLASVAPSTPEALKQLHHPQSIPATSPRVTPSLRKPSSRLRRGQQFKDQFPSSF